MISLTSFARTIGIAAALGLLLVSSPIHAKQVCFGKDEKLEVVADTKLKASDGAVLVLAHKTTTHCFLAPYWLTDDGFVLSVKGNNKAYYPLPDPEKLSALQAAGLVPSPFPIWKRSLVDWIVGYLIWWIILGFMIYLGYLKLKNPRSAYSKKIKGQNVSSENLGVQTRGMQTEAAGSVHSLASMEEIAGTPGGSKKPEKPKVRWKVVFSLVALIVATSALYLVLPKDVQYELQDAIKRPFSPNFDLPPNQMKSAKQDEWIAEYKRRGYNLTCYGNLRPEEQVSKDDDYNCWGLIKSAYDNIPARMIVFWFHKGELQHIKIEFPENSFTPLQDFLGRHFAGISRLDQKSSAQFGTDIYGRPLMVWPANHGLIVTSSSATPGHPLTLLWISHEKIGRDILAGLLSQIMPQARSTLQAPNTTGTASAATLPLGPNNTLVTIKKPAPNITNIETQGNLESTNNVGCVGPDKLSRKYSAADLYKAFTACLQQDMHKESIFLRAIAGAYGYFDTLRVADKTAHDAPVVMRMTSLETVDEKIKVIFFEKLKAAYSNPQAMAEICKDIIRIGPPDYFPRYMIQHGLKVLTEDTKNDDGLVKGFDSNAAWSQTLGKYLHCAGYETQKPSAGNASDAVPAQTSRLASAQETIVVDAKVLQTKRRKPSDLRYCLDLPSNYAIAKCAGQ